MSGCDQDGRRARACGSIPAWLLGSMFALAAGNGPAHAAVPVATWGATATTTTSEPATPTAAGTPTATGTPDAASPTAAGAPANTSPTPDPAATTDPAKTTDPSANASDDPTAPTTSTPDPGLREADVPGPTLDDGVLPCGLRVIIAQDASLPVAAVVLSLETGTEDDPSNQPGLIHALAYHLLQGNRELRPGGAAALVHDRGGATTLAVGPAQIRYESLVPISALSDVLWAESQRLRAPTVSDTLWVSTLRWARQDRSREVRIPRAATAAAHGVPGLEHDGRAVGPSLQPMVPRAVGRALAERMRYDLATLVVVSPHPPEELRATIATLFSDLPEHTRELRDRTPRWRPGSTPQPSPLANEKGQRFVWPVAPDPASLGLATVWCKAINRQRRTKGEPARARLRCHLDVDPRRATLVLVATGVEEPTSLLQTRVDRLEQGDDDSLIARQREAVRREWVQRLRGPLPLARRLATAAPRPKEATGWLTRPVDWLTGVGHLSPAAASTSGFGPHLQPGAAIRLMPAPAEAAP